MDRFDSDPRFVIQFRDGKASCSWRMFQISLANARDDDECPGNADVSVSPHHADANDYAAAPADQMAYGCADDARRGNEDGHALSACADVCVRDVL